MKFLGFIYMAIGALMTFVGIVSMASDVQLIIALCGINMFGLGLVMRK